MDSVLNTPLEYTYFYMSKVITSYTFNFCYLFLKSLKAFNVSLKQQLVKYLKVALAS